MRRTLDALEVSLSRWKRPDLGGVGHVRAAAELARHLLDLDHPHPVAVLLPEQRHRAQRLGLCARGLERVDGVARRDPIGDPGLHVGQLGLAEPLAVGEVEAQLVRPHVGARLADVRAEPLAQRRVQQMGGSVVAHGRQPRVALHGRTHRHRPGRISPSIGSSASA